MTANRMIFLLMHTYTTLFLSTHSRTVRRLCGVLLCGNSPFFLSVINVGAKISLSGDGEITAPKTDKNEYNIFNHLQTSLLLPPRCTASTRSASGRKGWGFRVNDCKYRFIDLNVSIDNPYSLSLLFLRSLLRVNKLREDVSAAGMLSNDFYRGPLTHDRSR